MIWLIALGVLAAVTPGNVHFTLCPLANMGLKFCPGCGLGKSITFLFHGEISKAWQAHPLGIFAVIVLSYRIVSLTLKSYNLWPR
jgi:hypothetical protein